MDAKSMDANVMDATLVVVENSLKEVAREKVKKVVDEKAVEVLSAISPPALAK